MDVRSKPSLFSTQLPLKLICFILLYGLCIFLTLNRHSKARPFTYHSELWADKAGYNVYLPAAFRYGFDARAFPDTVDQATGSGFVLHRATGKVETKYPYGVALLQTPFWLVGHSLSPDKSGYSKPEHKAIDLAGVTYFVVGLWLLFGTLRRYFSGGVTAVTLLLLSLGTNLWYYGVIETGMSHAYSFAAFALLLYLIANPARPAWYEAATTNRRLLTLALTLALISIVRPLNLVLALPLLAWPPVPGAAGRRPWHAATVARLGGWLLLTGSILWLPQLAYYHYLRGSWLLYSYGQEGFTNWLSPRLGALWFAPNNGSFLYNPLLLVALAGSLLLARRSVRWAALTLGIWAVATYLYAAWWTYALGCGYGGRGFVELYPILAWPLAAAVAYLAQRQKAFRWSAGVLLVLLVAYNLRLSFNFDRCFYGTSDWDWSFFQHLLV